MDLRLRYLEDGDAEKANYWLKGWKLNALPLALYPDTGLVLYNGEDNEDFYMGFLWQSNSKMAQLGFITRNPYYKVRLNKQTRKMLIDALISYARELGYEYVITWAEHEGIVNDFKELGFSESSNRVSELIVKI